MWKISIYANTAHFSPSSSSDVFIYTMTVAVALKCEQFAWNSEWIKYYVSMSVSVRARVCVTNEPQKILREES